MAHATVLSLWRSGWRAEFTTKNIVGSSHGFSTSLRYALFTLGYCNITQGTILYIGVHLNDN